MGSELSQGQQFSSYTDEQVKKYENSEEHKKWTDKISIYSDGMMNSGILRESSSLAHRQQREL